MVQASEWSPNGMSISLQIWVFNAQNWSGEWSLKIRIKRREKKRRYNQVTKSQRYRGTEAQRHKVTKVHIGYCFAGNHGSFTQVFTAEPSFPWRQLHDFRVWRLQACDQVFPGPLSFSGTTPAGLPVKGPSANASTVYIPRVFIISFLPKILLNKKRKYFSFKDFWLLGKSNKV